MNIDERVTHAIRILNKCDHRAYLVGGCVRDFLLGRKPKDWDITTSATPEEVMTCFGDEQIPVIKTGLKHGTVSVLVSDLIIEVTTFRKDGEYVDKRHPSGVTFINDLKEDLARRDFTMNALAYDPDLGTIDYFCGKSDLEHRKIRAVGDPDCRLQEDALRILRALRFSAVLGFDIEPNLAVSIHRNKNLLRNISCERISAELSKMIVGENIYCVLNDYSDVFSVFVPEIVPAIGFDQQNPHHIYDVWEHTVHSVALATPNTIVRLTMLFHDLGKPEAFSLDDEGVGHFYRHGQVSEEIASRRLRALKFDNETVHNVKRLIRWHDAHIHPNKLIRWLNRMDEGLLRLLFKVKRADALAQNRLYADDRLTAIEMLEENLDLLIANKACYKLKDLRITGADIIALGAEQGSTIGDILRLLLDRVMDGELENDKQALLSEAKDIISSDCFRERKNTNRFETRKDGVLT